MGIYVHTSNKVFFENYLVQSFKMATACTFNISRLYFFYNFVSSLSDNLLGKLNIGISFGKQLEVSIKQLT